MSLQAQDHNYPLQLDKPVLAGICTFITLNRHICGAGKCWRSGVFYGDHLLTGTAVSAGICGSPCSGND